MNTLFSKGLLLLVFFSAAGIYALAVVMTVRRLVRRSKGQRSKPNRLDRWMYRIVMGLAGLGILCGLYARLVEPYWLDVTHVSITSHKLPAGTRPIRIVHISDLHSDPAPRLEERLPHVIAEQDPDIIVFTGDALNSEDGLPVFKRCLSEIAKLAPTFAVKGNWDTRLLSARSMFHGTGARELEYNAARVLIRGVEVYVAGVSYVQAHLIPKVLEGIPSDAFTVLLYHTPDEIYEAARHNVDLYCAGHTHGGQVALPLYGALVTLSKFGKRFEAGLYRVEDTWLYVNRGIGMEGGAPRVRFCARPEVTVIEITPLEAAGVRGQESEDNPASGNDTPGGPS